jgi:hypothetical protein
MFWVVPKEYQSLIDNGLIYIIDPMIEKKIVLQKMTMLQTFGCQFLVLNLGD